MNKPVIIRWIDSKGITTDWEFRNELELLKPCICFSGGFLIDDTPEYKTISQTITKNQVLGRLTIPNCSIIKIKYIK